MEERTESLILLETLSRRFMLIIKLKLKPQLLLSKFVDVDDLSTKLSALK
jgi:hypothetical protein